MGNMKQVFDKWTVVECPRCKKHDIFYTNGRPLNADFHEYEYTCHDCHSVMRPIGMNDWTPKACCDIISCELEDRNYHRLVNVPNKLLEILDSIEDLSDGDKIKILKEFGGSLFE